MIPSEVSAYWWRIEHQSSVGEIPSDGTSVNTQFAKCIYSHTFSYQQFTNKKLFFSCLENLKGRWSEVTSCNEKICRGMQREILVNGPRICFEKCWLVLRSLRTRPVKLTWRFLSTILSFHQDHSLRFYVASICMSQWTIVSLRPKKHHSSR